MALSVRKVATAPAGRYMDGRGLMLVVKPSGAFYIFPEAPGGDGTAFVAKAIENNVLIIPGSVFSARNTHFRISFAAPDETLKRGVDVLNRIADQI